MKRVLVGCGLVMAIGLVGVIVASVATYSWWKQNAPDTAAFEEVQGELRETYGHPEDYEPPLDGRLDPARVEAYVRLRESVVAARDSIAESVSIFLGEVAENEGENESLFKGFGRGLSFAKRGIRVFGDGVRFLTLRAEAMREIGIGEGEYAYLDALATRGLLGWDPMRVAEDDPLSRVDRDVMEGVEEYVERHRDLVIDQLRGTRRTLEALEAPTPDERAFLETVTIALDNARDVRSRFPFEVSMPEEWITVLEPFSTRIQVTLPTTVGEILLEGSDQLFDEEGGGFTFDVQSG